MGSHFVTLDGDTGFWMSDGIARFWIFLLASHIEGDFEPESAGSRIRAQWMDGAKIEASGVVWDNLRRFGSDREARAAIVAALDRLTEALKAGPELVASEMVGMLGFELGSGMPMRRDRLLDLAHAWHDLLNDRVKRPARDDPKVPEPIWYGP